MEKAVEEQNLNGPYKAFLILRPDSTQKLSINVFRILNSGGAFDSLHPNRQQLFNNMDIILRRLDPKQRHLSTVFVCSPILSLN